VREAAQAKKGRARDLTIAALDELADRVRGTGAVLAVENVLLPQEIVYTAQELLSLVRDVGRPEVKALFDCGHAHCRGQDLAAFARTVAPELCLVHVNDNDGACDLHQQVGEGTIAYGPVFAALADSGYRGAVVLETVYASEEELRKGARLLEGWGVAASGGT
jgi:sugar phosphate isomerase/epimerase